MARHHSPACPRRVRPAPSYRKARGFPEGTCTRGRPYPQWAALVCLLAGRKSRAPWSAALAALNAEGPPERAFGGDCPELLDLDGSARFLELALELVGLVAVDALLDGLRGLVDERLGLLEPEAGRRAHDLDDLDLLVAGAGEDDVERRLLLLGLGRVAAARRRAAGRSRRDRGRGDAERLLERLDALGELEDGDRLELLDPLLGAGGHFLVLLGVSGGSVVSRRGGGGLLGRSLLGRGLLRGSLLGGGGRRGAAAHEALVGDQLQLARESGDQVVQRRHDAGERRGDHAHEPCLEHLARRKLRDRVDLFGREPGAVHPAALELEQRPACAAAEVAQRLGGGPRVAADERHRRRAFEQLLEPLGAGLVGRALAERVLDHAERGIGAAQLRAQLGGLRHGDAAVVDRVDGRRSADLRGHVVDDRSLLVSVQAIPPIPVLRQGRPESVEEAVGRYAAEAASCSTRSRMRLGSTFTPGPIVDAITMERMYLPLAADGLARISSSITAW